MNLTADTITDEQIRELQRSIAGRVFPASGMAHTGASETWAACDVALGNTKDPHYVPSPEECREARARCAEILNARKAK